MTGVGRFFARRAYGEFYPQNVASQQWIGCREQAIRASLVGGGVASLTGAHTQKVRRGGYAPPAKPR
jgi:hypothetical protein